MAIPNLQLVNPSSPGKIPPVKIQIPKTAKQIQEEKDKAEYDRLLSQRPKGLEKAINKINEFIIKIIRKVNEISYGKGTAVALPAQYASQTIDSSVPLENPAKTGIQKALDRGVINLLKELAGIDFCNLINYALKIPGSVAFNANKPPSDLSSFEGKVWRTQKRVYQGQLLIDKYTSIYNQLGLTNANAELNNVVKEISLLIKDLSSTEDGLNNPEFKKRFPEAAGFLNTISGIIAKINRTTGLQNISQKDLDTAVSLLSVIRNGVLQSILSLNLANITGAANFISNGKVLDEFNRLSQFVVPGPKILELLKKIIKLCNNIVDIANRVLRFITFAQTIIKVLLFLVKAIAIVRSVLTNIPLPAAMLPASVILTISEKLRDLKDIISNTLNRLGQILGTLSLISIAATLLISIMTDIINKLKLIILNIQNCYPDIADEMQDTVDKMTEASNGLQKFLNDYDTAKNRVDKTFGGYTIDIITEELVDEGIKLKRRYGIARGANNVIAVQSTPTFASLDLIIINEVKALLVSKGLVNIGLNGITTDEAAILLSATNYLGEQSINIDDIQFNASEFSDLVDEREDEIGLKTFFNNLPGGKAMRDRVRKKLFEKITKLRTDLKNNG